MIGFKKTPIFPIIQLPSFTRSFIIRQINKPITFKVVFKSINHNLGFNHHNNG